MVDRRIAGDVPLKDFFFEKWERQYYNASGIVSDDTLSQFDFAPQVSRFFDSGNIQVYSVRSLNP